MMYDNPTIDPETGDHKSEVQSNITYDYVYPEINIHTHVQNFCMVYLIALVVLFISLIFVTEEFLYDESRPAFNNF